MHFLGITIHIFWGYSPTGAFSGDTHLPVHFLRLLVYIFWGRSPTFSEATHLSVHFSEASHLVPVHFLRLLTSYRYIFWGYSPRTGTFSEATHLPVSFLRLPTYHLPFLRLFNYIFSGCSPTFFRLLRVYFMRLLTYVFCWRSPNNRFRETACLVSKTRYEIPDVKADLCGSDFIRLDSGLSLFCVRFWTIIGRSQSYAFRNESRVSPTVIQLKNPLLQRHSSSFCPRFIIPTKRNEKLSTVRE